MPHNPDNPYIIKGTESAPAILWAHALTEHGTVKWRGTKCGRLVNEEGEVIGSYYRSPRGAGWSVWTTPYAGFAYDYALEAAEQCTCPEFECSEACPVCP